MGDTYDEEDLGGPLTVSSVKDTDSIVAGFELRVFAALLRRNRAKRHCDDREIWRGKEMKKRFRFGLVSLYIVFLVILSHRGERREERGETEKGEGSTGWLGECF